MSLSRHQALYRTYKTISYDTSPNNDAFPLLMCLKLCWHSLQNSLQSFAQQLGKSRVPRVSSVKKSNSCPSSCTSLPIPSLKFYALNLKGNFREVFEGTNGAKYVIPCGFWYFRKPKRWYSTCLFVCQGLLRCWRTIFLIFRSVPVLERLAFDRSFHGVGYAINMTSCYFGNSIKKYMYVWEVQYRNYNNSYNYFFEMKCEKK